jgi:hypothetical protein
MPKTAELWSLSSLREKLIKIAAKIVRHGRYVTFQMVEVGVSPQMFARHPVADRSAAGTTCANMRGKGIECGRRRRQRCALISPNQRASPFRCPQPRALIASCSH